MFQWLAAGCACINTNRVKKVARPGLCIWAFLVLLVVQGPGVAVAGGPAPGWTVPLQQSSDDGYAELAWEAGGGKGAGLFKITETFRNEVTVHYMETTHLRAWRVEPGEYEFVLQSCVKANASVPDCGDASEPLMLVVNEVPPSPSGYETAAAPLPVDSNLVTSGGPDQLQPGHWYNPAKSGHGWSFYWSNRLALPEGDPLFGNNYDLVGIWYTFEAKYSGSGAGCSNCPLPAPIARWFLSSRRYQPGRRHTAAACLSAGTMAARFGLAALRSFLAPIMPMQRSTGMQILKRKACPILIR